MRMTVATAVACTLMMSLSMADEANAAIKKGTTIPAQGLGSALQQLAKDRDVQLVYRSEVVGDRQTGGAVGQLTLDEALTRLLAGSGLTYQYIEDSAVTIVPKRSSARYSALSTQHSSPSTQHSSLSAEDSALWDRFRLAQVDQASQPTSASSDNAEPKRITLEEVIVTAQKRTENLKDVPISISVLSGEDLDRSVEDVTYALRRVPGVTTMLVTTGGGTQLTVRGVTAAAPGLSGSGPIGYYLDSAPFALIRHAFVPDSNAYDLERIEVLRGPQGTLYGASSSNGVVRVLTKDADLDKFELKARTAGSSTQDGGENYRGDMAINVPIVDGKLAARAVAGFENLSGWIDRPNHKDANNTKNLNLRLKVNAQPTDKLSIGLSSWVSRYDSDARSTGAVNRTNISKVDEPISTDYDVYGLKIGYEFPGFSLSSMTSYLSYENASQIDYEALFGPGAPGAPCCAGQSLLSEFDAKVVTEEINLSSTYESAWRWTAGAIYRDAEDLFHQWRKQYANPNGNRNIDTSESFAVFGELTRFFLNRKFGLTGGLRYFEDRYVMQETSRLSEPVPVDPPFFIRREEKFDALSPRVTLTWHASDQLMTYASYSEGFRSGFAQQAGTLVQAPGFPPVQADNLTNYEVGAKGGLWGGRVSFDTAIYYIEWDKLQQSIVIRTNSGSGTIINLGAPVNGGSASGVGFDFGLTTRPISGLELSINYSRNELGFDADVVNSNGVLLFEKGDRLQWSPEETVGMSADYSFPLGRGGLNGRFSVSGNYSSEIHTRGIINGVSTILKSDSMLTARTSFTVDSSNRWSTSIFVENLTDTTDTPNRSTTAAQENIRIRPRTAGVQFEYRY